MTQTTKYQPPATASPPAAKAWARRAMGAGLAGGVVLAMIMMIVMAADGQGFWSPLNLGIPAFVYTIAPPLAMLPSLMAAMGISLPAATMSQLSGAIASGHISSAMAKQLGTMLMTMHVPAAKVQLMGQLMMGHATNSTVSQLLAGMPSSARNAVMAAMPISSGRVVVGLVLHMMMSLLLGVSFAAVILGARRAGISVLRTRAGVIGASMLGGAIVYVLMRWVLLPPTNSMMAFVPQSWFFIAHLMFGLVVGMILAPVLAGSSASSAR